MHASTRFPILLFAASLPALPLVAQDTTFRYPDTRKTEQVDEYFGRKVEDPYRWLEQDARVSEEVRDWVTAQNEVTFGYLETLPGREAIAKRLAELWNYPRVSAPFHAGGRWYISRNDGLQNHNVLYTMDEVGGAERVVFDPNTWSEDGTVALGETSFSPDGRFVAYSIQEAGSDWRTWRVRDLRSGEDTGDVLRYLKFTRIAWEKDGSGFFYSKYPDPQVGAEFTSLNLEAKLMHHRIGAQQADDVVVYWRPEHPEWNYGMQVTDDGRYLVIWVSVGTDAKYRVYIKDLQREFAAPMPIVDEFENDFSLIGNDGPVFYWRTDDSAPRNRVVAIDVRAPGRENWREILPEDADGAVMQGVSLVHNMLAVNWMRDVQSAVSLFTLDGKKVRDVELPGVGTVSGFEGEREDTEVYFTFSSFAVPPSTYRHDLITGETELFHRPEVAFDPDAYVTKQIFYESKDGTRVPMFVTHKVGIELDGTNPTLLYGYGGFNISLRPGFSVSRLGWMDLGGVYVVANLRGGGEYGRAWHEGGKKQNKQNVFDDFVAAAEHLIEIGYTSPEKLAIQGGSNGGLLVGAVMCQRPDLFGVCLPAVGVMDMLRFDAFTAGRYWTDDYGSSSESQPMFEYLLGYSPYHALKPGMSYPATLVTTADTDDRVVPGHSFKFAARLQECHEGSDPVMIRIQTGAGHGSGKPTSMIIQELADVYAFTAKHLGMDLGAVRGGSNGGD
jgi:prolyl oligopeptidase